MSLASQQKYHRSKKGLIGNLYQSQKRSSRSRNHPLPTYTLDELREAILDMPLFHTLHDNWVASDYEKGLTPSLDRIDDYQGYTEDNIQLMTWAENEAKGNKDRKEGRNNKINRAVEQFTLDEEYITTYHSMREAERVTGISSGNIHGCCNFKAESASSFKWQYSS